MSPKHYDLQDIKKIPVANYLVSIGAKVLGNRSNAPWHKNGGDNPQAISLNTKKNLWHDFVEGRGGSVIDLCMLVEGKTLCEAINALAERFNITATDETKTNNPKPKRKVEPNWVRVSWLIIHAADGDLLEDARRHLNKGGDYLTDADLKWARRVAELLSIKMLGASLDEAILVAVKMFRKVCKEAA